MANRMIFDDCSRVCKTVAGGGHLPRGLPEKVVAAAAAAAAIYVEFEAASLSQLNGESRCHWQHFLRPRIIFFKLNICWISFQHLISMSIE